MNNQIQQLLADGNLPISQLQQLLTDTDQVGEQQQDIQPNVQQLINIGQNVQIDSNQSMAVVNEDVEQVQPPDPNLDQAVSEPMQLNPTDPIVEDNPEKVTEQVQAEENKDMENEGIDGNQANVPGQKALINDEQSSKQNEANEMAEEEYSLYHINANVNQIAMLNKMLPKGFKFDIQEVIKRQTEIHLKKTAGLANFQKKPEILNEKRQQKIFQKHAQKREREKQKLAQKQSMIKDQLEMQGMMDSFENTDNVENQQIEPKNNTTNKSGAKIAKTKSTKETTQPTINASKQNDPAPLNDSLKKSKSEFVSNSGNNKLQKNASVGNAKEKKQQEQSKVDKHHNQGSSLQGQSKKKDKKETVVMMDEEEEEESVSDYINKIPNNAKSKVSVHEPQNNKKDHTANQGLQDNMNQNEICQQLPVNNNSVEIIISDNKELEAALPDAKKKRGRKPGSTKEKLAAAKHPGSSIQEPYTPTMEPQLDEMQNKKESGLKGRKGKNKGNEQADGSKGGQEDDGSLINENDLISLDMMADIQAKRGSIFADIDMTKFNIYDKYYKLLVSIVTHEELYKLGDVPLFLKVPNEHSKFFQEMKMENHGVGYLNFNMNLQRLKSKKYGPGKNMIKEDILQMNIRNVFRICEKYYGFDPLSMRISKILEEHFEKELAQSPDLKTQKFQQAAPKNDSMSGIRDKSSMKKDNGLVGGKRGSQIGSIDDGVPENAFDEISSVPTEDEKKRKRDKKKDKKEKKEKKKKDKKHKESKSSKDNDDAGSEDREQQKIKQQLYEDITNHLNIEQKKGIIPIVFKMNQDNPNMQEHQSTYEFDLFSLQPHICKRLQQYVKECIIKNEGGTVQDLPEETKSEPLKSHVEVQNQQPNDFDIKDQIQNQIDEKLKEHYMFEDNNRNDMSLTAQMQKAIEKTNTMKEKPEQEAPNYVDENGPQPYDQDRYALIQKINTLDNKQLRGIVPIVKDFQAVAGEEDEQKLEFDLYDLPDNKCKELHNYVEKCLLETREAEEKAVQEAQIKEQIKLLMDQQKQKSNQDLLQQQLRYQQQLQQQIYGPQEPPNQQPHLGNALANPQTQIINDQAAIQAQLDQAQLLQQQQSIAQAQSQQQAQAQQQNLLNMQQQLNQQMMTDSPQQPQNQPAPQMQNEAAQAQQQMQQFQQQLLNQQQLQMQQANAANDKQSLSVSAPQQASQPAQQQLSQQLQSQQLQSSGCSNQLLQQQTTAASQMQQQQQQNPSQNAQNNQSNEFTEYNEKFELSKVLKALDQDTLDLLGQVMTSQEYLALHSDQDISKGIKQDDQTIELDIQKLNNNQIKFLKNFAENPQVQAAYRQEFMKDQPLQEVVRDDKKEQIVPQNSNPEVQQDNNVAGVPQNEQIVASASDLQQKMEAETKQYQEIQLQITQNMESQMQQLQETQMMMQQMAQIQQQQGGQLQHDQQQQFNQLICNESILQQNILQLQQYKVNQDQLYEQAKQQNLQSNLLQQSNEQQPGQQTAMTANNAQNQMQASTQNEQQQQIAQSNAMYGELGQENQEISAPNPEEKIISQPQDNQQVMQAKQGPSDQIAPQEQAIVQPNEKEQLNNEQIPENKGVQDIKNDQVFNNGGSGNILQQQQVDNDNKAQGGAGTGGEPITQPQQVDKPAQMQEAFRQLIMQYQLNQQELEQKVHLSQQLQQLYMQVSQQQQQMQNSNASENEKQQVLNQMQQINGNLIDTQNQIQQLASNQQVFEQEIMKIQSALKEGEIKPEDLQNLQANSKDAGKEEGKDPAQPGAPQQQLSTQGPNEAANHNQQQQLPPQQQQDQQQLLQQQALQQLQQEMDNQQLTQAQQTQLQQQYLMQLQQHQQQMMVTNSHEQMQISEQQKPHQQQQMQQDLGGGTGAPAPCDSDLLQNQQQVSQTPFNTQIEMQHNDNRAYQENGGNEQIGQQGENQR